MNLEKVVFGFFVLLAATLNFGFFIGDIGDPDLHNAYELYAAIFVNLIATVLKFGDRTQIGAVHLATSLVADLQLISAALVWGYVSYVTSTGSPARRRPASCRCRAARWWPTSCRWCCSWSRPCRSTGAEPPAWATRCSSSGPGCSTATSSARSVRSPTAGADGVGHPGVGHDLPGPAAHAGAADRLDRHLLREHAGADADPGAGRRRAPLAHGFFDAFYVSYTARRSDSARSRTLHLQPAHVGHDLAIP